MLIQSPFSPPDPSPHDDRIIGDKILASSLLGEANEGEAWGRTPLADGHCGLGLGPPHTFTGNDDPLPDIAQVWVWAESCLVRGISPTQGRQSSRVLVEFSVNGVFLTHVSVSSDSNPQRNVA